MTQIHLPWRQNNRIEKMQIGFYFGAEYNERYEYGNEF